MSVSVCGSVCLSVREHISGTTRVIFTKFLCMLPAMSVVRSSPDMFTIGRIACRLKGVFFSIENALLVGKGGGSAQRGRSMLYDCLVFCCIVSTVPLWWIKMKILYSYTVTYLNRLSLRHYWTAIVCTVYYQGRYTMYKFIFLCYRGLRDGQTSFCGLQSRL